MNKLPDFEIQSNGEISREFLSRDIQSFHEAVEFIRNLRYGRNADKNDPKAVFADNKGTCSTKHALLKKLADEHNVPGIRLMLGIFRMNGNNTPQVAGTLNKNGLAYLPEAHMYLKYENQVFDFTRRNSRASDFEQDLLVEQELKPGDIDQPKIELHKKYLSDWLRKYNDQLKKDFTLSGIWEIREQCIRDLSS